MLKLSAKITKFGDNGIVLPDFFSSLSPKTMI